MLKNYFQIALRQLRKQKMYSSVKIGGFALGIAACLLITLYIRDELSFDRSWADADHIYRMVDIYTGNGKIEKGPYFQAPFAQALKKEFPEVEKAGRLMSSPLFYGAGSNEVMIAGKTQNSYEEGFAYADQELLDILGIPMVYGDRAHALAEPNTMVLSRRVADKYFPNTDPTGKLLILNNDKAHPYKIGGVMENFPSNSHLHYEVLLTMTGKELWPGEQELWGPTNYFTYLLLRPGTDPSRLAVKMKSIIKKYVVPQMLASGNKDAENVDKYHSYALQPITDINLRSYDIQDGLSHGDIRFVWLFGAIACFILIIACINFINLTTARSANRAREVGLRKVVGSLRSSLIVQFLAESMLFAFFSFAVAIVLAWLLLPYFNILAAKSLTIPWGAWWLAPLAVASAIVIGILAGIYPSFYLSGFKPIQVLKGQIVRSGRNAGMRSILVVFQFTTSVILIISTVVVYRQMQFILHQKIGFDKDQVVLIQGTGTLGDEKVRTFKNELMKLSAVKIASISDYLPIAGTKRNGNPFWKEGKTTEESSVGGQNWVVDNNYIRTMGMKIVEGRDFSENMLSDSDNVIINQTLAKQLGLTNPIGKNITNGHVYHIIGIVEDFNFESMKGEIGGLFMRAGLSPSIVSVRVNTADLSGALRSISAVWKKFSPDQPVRYAFLSESFARMYDDVQRMGNIFTSFAVLAIIIACLGLFALSAFMAERRSKEISIRKVLGASVGQVTVLLSKDFIRLVILALAIGSPIAWWAMHKWLQDYAYRTPIGAWVFFAAGLLVVAIALATISFQAIKAAVADPAKNLRSE